MMKPSALVLAAFLVVGVTPHVVGQTRSPETIVKNLDKNGDGRISAREAENSPMQFEKVDADSDGYVTLTELKSAGGGGGRSASQDSDPEAAIKAQDLNGDGRIGLREWMNHHERRFLKIDIDGDGYLTVEELSSER